MNFILEFSQQIEAPIFNYVSFGFNNNIISTSTLLHNSFWTLVAVLTAAISFWTSIRAVSFIISPSHPNYPRQKQEAVAIGNKDEAAAAEGVTLCSSSSSSSSSSLCSALTDDDGTIKGKLTVHYNKEDGVVNYDQLDNDEEEELTPVMRSWWDDKNGDFLFKVIKNDQVLYPYCQSWEQMLQVRSSGDMEYWYGYQDLTSLNGSIVKLWRRC